MDSIQQRLLAIFRQFRTSISTIEWSVQFWGGFLQQTLTEHWIEKQENRMVFQALFAVYDIPSVATDIWLWVDPDERLTITADELEAYRVEFFRVVRNLALVKAYNALEMLLFQAAVLRHFPTEISPTGKNMTKRGDELIKKAFRENQAMGKLETKNNRHLLAFLSYHCPNMTSFTCQPIRSDCDTTWANFFEFASIVRHINTHHGGLMTRDSLNELQSTSKEIFERSFSYTPDEDSLFILYPLDGDRFLFIPTLLKDFAVNSLKFIFDQPDLSFLDLRSC